MKIRGNTIGTTMKPEKTVVKCEKLTEEEKAIARANIGAASADTIGDIETALDTILAIQNELTGETPVVTITFTIDGTVYTANDGMTWGEWIDSEYNTDGLIIMDGVVHKNGLDVCYGEDCMQVESAYIIIANAEYGFI